MVGEAGVAGVVGVAGEAGVVRVVGVSLSSVEARPFVAPLFPRAYDPNERSNTTPDLTALTDLTDLYERPWGGAGRHRVSPTAFPLNPFRKGLGEWAAA